MSVDVEVEVVIDRPVVEVASYAADPGNAPAWYANIASMSRQTPPPVSVGSQVNFVAHFLGRTLAYTYQVVELDPQSRLVMRTGDGPFPMERAMRRATTKDLARLKDELETGQRG